MKAVSLHELKKELAHKNEKELIDLCIHLSKYKKENKEFMTYLVFDADNEAQYIQDIKNEMEEMFLDINYLNLYYIKKTLRKILRHTKKHIKFSQEKSTEIELLIYFLKKTKENKIKINQSTQLINLYNGVVKRIEKILGSLHEDLRFDYNDDFEEVRNY